MIHFLSDTGIFAYPLIACSLIALYVITERLLNLRSKQVFPNHIERYLCASDRTPDFDPKDLTQSAAGRIIQYFYTQAPDSETLKAYVNLEVKRLERGLNWLDMIVGIAPLLGLMGTVAGLVSVFGAMPAGTQSMNDNMFFAQGIALALSTTLCGLGIAIPTMVANSFLNRRIDCLEARLYLLSEQLSALSFSASEKPSYFESKIGV